MVRPSMGTRERIEFGRDQRRRLKRSDHAHWDAKQRKHDPVEIILAVNRERIPALVPIKMARMAASPFGYFRGNVPVIAADLGAMRSSGITVQICGDAHVRNLGRSRLRMGGWFLTSTISMKRFVRRGSGT